MDGVQSYTDALAKFSQLDELPFSLLKMLSGGNEPSQKQIKAIKI